MAKRAAAALAAIAVVSAVSCGGGVGGGGTEIRRIGLDGIADVITKNGVAFDGDVTVDGRGSIRVAVDGPATIRLAQLADIDLEDAFLVYQASLRTERLEGETYLEMFCVFDGRGEYYSRGLDHALSGTNDWRTVSTPFRLRAGENPDAVKLNLFVNGAGTVWIDDIRLLRRPLR
ncbi:MAG: hypothetical protein PHQ19_05955 [Candidatus Krumholzibacteria bacterium]|nr:hypothetical protein [Candidatus Krumholzibacteria bacterium]